MSTEILSFDDFPEAPGIPPVEIPNSRKFKVGSVIRGRKVARIKPIYCRSMELVGKEGWELNRNLRFRQDYDRPEILWLMEMD